MMRTVFYILCFFVFLAVLAPFMSLQDLRTFKPLYLENQFRAPFAWPYVLGTDMYGRDMLSALLFGLRTTFFLCGAAVASSFFLGSFLGLCGAYYGGFTLRFLKRAIDFSLSFPTLILAFLWVGFFKGGAVALYLSFLINGWAYFARAALSVGYKEVPKEYIDEAKLLGRSGVFIVIRHLFPNCFWASLVLVPSQFAHSIVVESALPFLGVSFGQSLSLGALMHRGFDYFLSGKPWLFLFPFGVLVFILVCLGFLTDGLQQRLNPKRQTAR